MRDAIRFIRFIVVEGAYWLYAAFFYYDHPGEVLSLWVGFVRRNKPWRYGT
jgi:hypothetical protein